MELKTTNRLTPYEQEAVRHLAKICQEADHISYDPYLGEEDVDEDLFVLAYEENNLCGFLSCFMTESGDITGFVVPALRKRGIFSSMFASVYDAIEDTGVLEILFAGNEQQPGFVECAKHLKATERIEEYLMEYHGEPENPESSHLTWLKEEDEESTGYFFTLDDHEIGSCSLYEESTRINLYDIFVEPEYRGFGHGKNMLLTILYLYKDSGKRIMLQVSDKNKAAYSLYLSCGFEIKETVVYYSRFV